MGSDPYPGDRDIERLLGLRPLRWSQRPETVAEQQAEAEVVARILSHEDHYGVGRLPYWLRYYSPVLRAEYQVRMAELARAMALLDRLAQAEDAQEHYDPLGRRA